jgi:plastocyanin
MHHWFKLLALLLFATACNRSAGLKVDRDTVSVAWGDKERESLFDTTTNSIRNTAHYHSVEIRQMKFVPQEIRVHAGDTIAWINNDIVVHDITEEKNKQWSSSALAVGSSWQRVADKSTDYFCSIHTMMKGRIVVE